MRTSYYTGSAATKRRENRMVRRMGGGKASAGGHPAYRPDIDGLRAVAVLAVVAFHAYPSVYRGGFVGVDVFFVISGFLISTIILGQVTASKFRFGEFYARRVRRIFPALVVVLLACMATGWVVLLPTEYAQLGAHTAGGTGFASNFVLWREAGYFDASADTKLLLHLWSLGIEEQFYLVWPLLLVVAGARRALVVIVLVAVASFAANLAFVHGHDVAVFYNPLTRFWELAIGAMLAYLELRAPAAMQGLRARTFAREATSLAGAVLLVAAIALLDSTLPFPGWRALLPTAGAFALIAAGPSAIVNRLVLSNRVAVAIGLISYPLYLLHWPALAFARVVRGITPTFTMRTVAVVASIAAAYLVYRFVERPLRHARSTRFLIVANVALFAIGLVLYEGRGLAAARGPWSVDEVDHTISLADFSTPECRHDLGSLFVPAFDRTRDDCHSTRPLGDNVDALVLGDSHAGRIYVGLREAAPSASFALLGRNSCMPWLGYDGFAGNGTPLDCASTFERLVAQASKFAPRVVVLTAFYESVFNGHIRHEVKEPIPALAAKTIARLAADHPRVVVVLDVPLLPFDPSECVTRPFNRGHAPGNGDCSFPRAVADASRALYEADLRRATDGLPNVVLFDPTEIFCTADLCFAARDRRLLYDDNHHLSRLGAKLVGERLHALIR